MEAFEIAAQLLEMVAGRHTQILIDRRVVNHLELAEQAAFEIGRNIAGVGVVHEESPQPSISKADDDPMLPARR